MKYTVSSDQAGKPEEKIPASAKKVGFFSSETELISLIRGKTGLQTKYARHPLTYIMEACDDIAYLIVDAEDAVKKQIVSFHDLMAWLESSNGVSDDTVAQWVIFEAKRGEEQARCAKLSPSELNDVSMQIFRAQAITAMVSVVIKTFEAEYERIMNGEADDSLINLSTGKAFAERMRKFDQEHAYRHRRRVLEQELEGYNVISELLYMLWRGISERETFDVLNSPRSSPFARYAYGRISENYRRVFEGDILLSGWSTTDLPIRYREIQLLTDMVAGMTDQFAIDMYRELKGFHIGAPTNQTN
jgi:dGTPase